MTMTWDSFFLFYYLIVAIISLIVVSIETKKITVGFAHRQLSFLLNKQATVLAYSVSSSSKNSALLCRFFSIIISLTFISLVRFPRSFSSSFIFIVLIPSR